VHLITIFVNIQLDAQFFFLYLFIPVLYMFRATKCSSSEESVVYQRSYLYSWLFWWWALGCSKHAENWNQ